MFKITEKGKSERQQISKRNNQQRTKQRKKEKKKKEKDDVVIIHTKSQSEIEGESYNLNMYYNITFNSIYTIFL